MRVRRCRRHPRGRLDRAPLPQTRAEFLDRRDHDRSPARTLGLVSQDELVEVLRAAVSPDASPESVSLSSTAPPGCTPRPSTSAVTAAVTWRESVDADGIRVVDWIVPPALAAAAIAPAVAITTGVLPAPSGWFTEVPMITVT
ncbi:hypothetical protein, partial [Microbacterium sp. UFMG61]|uniref:hypothetical protein n=1 Tax=Microbacterium sp. UFMG61 TaxID=2745935 RepID=UPI001E31D454